MAKAHKAKNFDRRSAQSLSKGTGLDPKGRIFSSSRQLFDLSHILFCGASVDTIRQLYRGVLRSEVLERLKDAAEGSGFIEWAPGEQWAVGRMGMASGYRYKLQNNEVGMIALIGSYYAEEDREGSHLKIELSPHFISRRGVTNIQARLAYLACQILKTSEPVGCAVHLALDVQGWAPPSDFGERFVTRARAVRAYDGIKDIGFDFKEVSCIYGKESRQSYMYGKSNALQAVVYEKSTEIVKSDKVDYFQEQWGDYTFGQYDKTQPVWRVEMRLHHNVIAEIAEGQGESWKTFRQVSEHLTDIWRYCLNANRLDHSCEYIDPVWQLFRDDAEFYHPADGLCIRRKKKEDQSAIGHNYSIILGNVITVFSRQLFDAESILREMKKLAFYRDMRRYYELERKMDEPDILELIRKGVTKRKTLGKAA